MAIVWEDPPWPLVAEPALPVSLDYTLLPVPAEDPLLQTIDPHVKLAQALLNAAGWSPPLVVDGKFGPRTRDAVVWLQLRSLILPSGTIDADTWLALATSAPLARLEPGPGVPPMTGPPIALVQELLNEAGAFPALAVDGSFNQATGEALRTFQRGRGLADTGVVDPSTWTALGYVRLDEGPLAAARLTYRHDSAWWGQPNEPPVRLISIEIVETPAPPSAPLGALEPLAGAWLEVWDERDRPIYRQFLYEPFGLTRELLPGEPGEAIARVAVAAPRGEFEVVVPIQGRSTAVAIYSSPLNPALSHQPATLLRVDRL